MADAPSCSLGLPAPLTLGAVDDGHWEEDDLHEFTDHVEWFAIPTAAPSA